MYESRQPIGYLALPMTLQVVLHTACTVSHGVQENYRVDDGPTEAEKAADLCSAFTPETDYVRHRDKYSS